jgi:hypothetical protein
LSARVHDFASTNFADPCKSGESRIPDWFSSRGGCSTTEEMKEEHHDTDYEQDVDQPGGNVKSEKAQ